MFSGMPLLVLQLDPDCIWSGPRTPRQMATRAAALAARAATWLRDEEARVQLAQFVTA